VRDRQNISPSIGSLSKQVVTLERRIGQKIDRLGQLRVTSETHRQLIGRGSSDKLLNFQDRVFGATWQPISFAIKNDERSEIFNKHTKVFLEQTETLSWLDMCASLSESIEGTY